MIVRRELFPGSRRRYAEVDLMNFVFLSTQESVTLREIITLSDASSHSHGLLMADVADMQDWGSGVIRLFTKSIALRPTLHFSKLSVGNSILPWQYSRKTSMSGSSTQSGSSVGGGVCTSEKPLSTGKLERNGISEVNMT